MTNFAVLVLAATLALPATLVQGHGCPHIASTHGHNQQEQQQIILPDGLPADAVVKEYGRELEKLPWKEVRADLRKLFRGEDFQADWWPADYEHYGGLFVRLTWHSCGSYRKSDGRGGCDGGNQRFDPERSWPDNTSLDKARKLLEPIKLKYGVGLSWGDLMTLAGTEAIRDMGGPVLGFCGGRIDTVDNSQTILLGPTPEQDKFAPCEVRGDCQPPLGTNTLGLIYVNPEGKFGEPDPVVAAGTIRDVFGRMGMNDRETVALIGGGHTFGKAHGACPDGAGPSPAEDPDNPWPGECGTGRGNDTFTSGFEGPWTSHPTRWDNNYFRYLLKFEWEAHVGPGGHYQWRVKGGGGPRARVAYPPDSHEKQDVMMLTTDVALIRDPEYAKYVKEFAEDEDAFSDAFAQIWYELASRDMGPVTRCSGPDVPPARHFQYPLPDPPAKLADMRLVEADLHKQMEDRDDGEFIRLAWQCASTFRVTDYRGGCNGARIRHPPGRDWPANQGLDQTLSLLEPVKEKFGEGLSWADLIVLAGNVALQRAGAASSNLPFCPGRTDAVDGKGWQTLEFGNAEPPASVDAMIEINQRRGLSAKELVVLSWASKPSGQLSGTKYLRDMLTSSTQDDVVASGLQNNPELRVWAEYYVSAGDRVFASDLAAAWTKMMNADRFDGPTGNLCYNTPHHLHGDVLAASLSAAIPAAESPGALIILASLCGIALVVTLAWHANRLWKVKEVKITAEALHNGQGTRGVIDESSPLRSFSLNG